MMNGRLGWSDGAVTWAPPRSPATRMNGATRKNGATRMNGRGDSDEWDDSDDPTVHPSHLGGECCDAAGVTWAATFHRPGDSNVATSRHDPLGKGREGWNEGVRAGA